MGRLKQPRELRIANGNPSRRELPLKDMSLRRDEIKTSIDADNPPKHLNKEGKLYYKSIVSLGNWLNIGDIPTITLACESYQILKQIENDLDKWKKQYVGRDGLESGELLEEFDAKGNVTYKQNPLGAQRMRYFKLLEGYLKTLCFNPVQRTHLSNETENPNKHSPTAEFFD